jgi:hypothetical protein
MLQSFEKNGGIESLFDAFYWALSLWDENNTTTGDKDKLEEGIVEFIESWLVLIQKLLTTKFMSKIKIQVVEALICLWDLKFLKEISNYIIEYIIEAVSIAEKPRRNSQKDTANKSFELIARTVSPVVDRKINFE